MAYSNNNNNNNNTLFNLYPNLEKNMKAFEALLQQPSEKKYTEEMKKDPSPDHSFGDRQPLPAFFYIDDNNMPVVLDYDNQYQPIFTVEKDKIVVIDFVEDFLRPFIRGMNSLNTFTSSLPVNEDTLSGNLKSLIRRTNRFSNGELQLFCMGTLKDGINLFTRLHRYQDAKGNTLEGTKLATAKATLEVIKSNFDAFEVFFVSLLIAHKYREDLLVDNGSHARFMNLNLNRINRLEEWIFAALDYEIGRRVTTIEFAKRPNERISLQIHFTNPEPVHVINPVRPQ